MKPYHLLPLAATTITALPLAGPPASSVSLTSVTYSGTGCSSSSAVSIFSGAASAVTVALDSYIATIGSGVSPSENKKTCKISLSLSYPAGWQYKLSSGAYRGFASVEGGVTGVLKNKYSISGGAPETAPARTWNGPTEGDYVVSESATSWSACGSAATLTIDSEVELTGTGSSGVLALDSVDFGLAWRAC